MRWFAVVLSFFAGWLLVSLLDRQLDNDWSELEWLEIP